MSFTIQISLSHIARTTWALVKSTDEIKTKNAKSSFNHVSVVRIFCKCLVHFSLQTILDENWELWDTMWASAKQKERERKRETERVMDTKNGNCFFLVVFNFLFLARFCWRSTRYVRTNHLLLFCCSRRCWSLCVALARSVCFCLLIVLFGRIERKRKSFESNCLIATLKARKRSKID